MLVFWPPTVGFIYVLGGFVAALPACDRRGEQWQAIDTAIAELAHLRSQS